MNSLMKRFLILADVWKLRTASISLLFFYAWNATVHPASGQAIASVLDHFDLTSTPSPQTSGIPFVITVTAKSADGITVTNFTGSVFLEALIRSNPSVVLITEVQAGFDNRVEFANGGEGAQDLSGWEIFLYDPTTWPEPTQKFSIPEGTVCPAGEIFQLHAGGVAPGSYPDFRTGAGLAWVSPGDKPVAVLLVDADGGARDFVCAMNAYANRILHPFAIPLSLWSGTTLPLIKRDIGETYQRIGFLNHHNALDWIIEKDSMGVLNRNLRFPFLSGSLRLAATPAQVDLIQGVWSGNIVIADTASNIVLRADDGAGHPGDSIPFSVVAGPQIIVELSLSAREAQAGLVGLGRVSIPLPVSADLLVSLLSTNTKEIVVPVSVTIPAGQMNASFSVTNFDDADLDGTQYATITASAPDFVSGSAVIANIDNETATLSISMPSSAREGDGILFGAGTVSVSAPVAADVRVDLTSSNTNKVRIPDFVVVASGQTSTNFSLAIINNQLVDGPSTVSVTAHVENWSDGAAKIVVEDNDVAILSVTTPSELLEGDRVITNVAALRLSVGITSNLVVQLLSSNPSAVMVPGTVAIGAGQTLAAFSLLLADDPASTGNQKVIITAVAQGFPEAKSTISILDNKIHHFAIRPIGAPERTHERFVATIIAENVDNSAITSFNGRADLRGVDARGDVIVEPAIVIFTNGVWRGSVLVNAEGLDLRLVADDRLGHTGASNPFTVADYRIVRLPCSDLVYDSVRGKIYAGVLGSAGTLGKTLITIKPDTGDVEESISLESEPGSLALSDDHQFLYVAVESGAAVRRLDLRTKQFDPQFASNLYIEEMQVLPGQPSSIAIIALQGTWGLIYDNGVLRTNATAADFQTVPGLGLDREYDGRMVYLVSGQAVDPVSQVAYYFPGFGRYANDVEPDAKNRRVYFLLEEALQVFDQDTYEPVGSLSLNVYGFPGPFGSLTRFGSDGLAFKTSDRGLVLMHTALVPSGPPAELRLSQTISQDAATVGSSVTIACTITNKGPRGATGVRVEDLLPPGLELVSATSTRGTCTNTGNTVVCDCGSITNGDGADFTIIAKVISAGWQTNVVRVRAFEPNTSQSNNVVTLGFVTRLAETPLAVQLISLPTQDIVYDPATEKIIASVPLGAGNLGNQLVAVDPHTGLLAPLAKAGDEPGKLAIAPSGRKLFVASDGDSTVRLFDTVTKTFDPPFSIGTDLRVQDIAILSLDPQVIAVTRYTLGPPALQVGVAAYREGVPLAQTGDSVFIEAAPGGKTLYGRTWGDFNQGPTFSRYILTPDGLSRADTLAFAHSYQSDMSFDGKSLYFSDGQIFDPGSLEFVGSFLGVGTDLVGGSSLVAPDASIGRAYFLSWSGTGWMVQEFDENSRALLGTLAIPGVNGTPGSLIRWGPEGLAFRTSEKQLFLLHIPDIPRVPSLSVTQVVSRDPGIVDTELTYSIMVTNRGPVSATGVTLVDPVPAGATFVSASASQGTTTQDFNVVTFNLGIITNSGSAQLSLTIKPRAAGILVNSNVIAADLYELSAATNSSSLPILIRFGSAVQVIKEIAINAADIVFDPSSQNIYASVADSEGLFSNCVVAINPTNGALGASISLGSPAGSLALSDDGQFLYAAMSTGGVVRIDLATQTVGLRFSLGEDAISRPLYVGDMEVMPGNPHTLAVSRSYGSLGGSNAGVVIYDDGQPRPQIVPEREFGSVYFIAFGSASNLYSAFPLNFRRISIDASGASLIDDTTGLIPGYEANFEFDGGLIFSTTGRVFDPAALGLVGTFPVSGLVVPDSASGRVYFVTSSATQFSGPLLALRVFDKDTFSELWSLPIPPYSGTPVRMIRCRQGLAFITDAKRLFVVASEIMPSSPTSDLSLTNSSLPAAVTAGGKWTYSFTVSNNGPWTAANVVVSNFLAAGVSFLSASSTHGTCGVTNDAVICVVDSLPNGASVTMTVTVSPSAPGSITTSATVSHADTDPDTSNNSATTSFTVVPAPNVSIDDAAVLEGNRGVSLRVHLSAPTSETVTVGYGTADGTAVNPNDYAAVTGVVTFRPGATNGFINISIMSDTLIEPEEKFSVNLLSATNTIISKAQGVVTIVNDDTYFLAVTNVTVLEGESGITNVTFNVTLQPAQTQTVMVGYQTADGSAIAGRDYLPKSGILIFSSGATNKTVSIPVYGNTAYEPNKTFFLVLHDAVNADLGVNQAMVSILNDDPLPPLAITSLIWDGPDLLIEFLAGAGYFYWVEYSGSLPSDSWVRLTGNIAGTADLVRARHVYGALFPQGFYRVHRYP